MLFVSLRYEKTGKGLHMKILSRWIEVNSDRAIVLTQVLRNIILVNSAFISAMLVLTGILLGLYNQIFITTDYFLFVNIPLGLVQISSIIVSIFLVLFSFINSNRMATTLNFVITSNDPEKNITYDTKETAFAEDTFKAMQTSWMLGIRAIFFLIANITWIFHPIFFLIGSGLITVYMVVIRDLSILNRVLAIRSKKIEK
jgi:uncharacterized membrane protein